MNVLLVDDEFPALSELYDAVSAVLPKAQIFRFLKAREAMDFATETSIDIAFLDINMFFIDGITMAKKLKEIYPKCNIIFCTGFSEYALEAWNTYSSAYLLKPISEEKVKKAIEHLRYPLPKIERRTEIRCFGNFDVLVDGVPVAFKYKKARELLAYLVDLNGAEATTREIMAAIFEDDKPSYFGNVRLDLIDTFQALGVPQVISAEYGRMRVVRDQVKCDYFDYLDGTNTAFFGKYMSQYSFAETTYAMLIDKNANYNSGYPYGMIR